MRPQFGSDPAIAVFTSGEFAMVRAIRSASCFVRGAFDVDGHQLPRAFAVARDLLRQRFQHLGQRRLERLARRA